MRSLLLFATVATLCWTLPAEPANAQVRLYRPRGCRYVDNGYYPPARWQTQLNFSYPSTYDPRPNQSGQANLPAGYVPKHLKLTRPVAQPPQAANPSRPPATNIPKPELATNDGTLPGPQRDTPVPPPPIADTDILAFGASKANLKTIMELLKISGLAEEITGAGPYTIFAPTDEAFAALPPQVLEALKANPVKLKDVLMNHGVADLLLASDLKTLENTTSLIESPLAIRNEGEALYIGGAKVLEADHRCTNGVVHLIDSVLLLVANDTP